MDHAILARLLGIKRGFPHRGVSLMLYRSLIGAIVLAAGLAIPLGVAQAQDTSKYPDLVGSVAQAGRNRQWPMGHNQAERPRPETRR